MSKKQIKIPDGMMGAVDEAISKARYLRQKHYGNDDLPTSDVIYITLNSALLWLSENPIVPSDEQLFNISGNLPVKMAQIVWSERDRALIAEWQRCMFLIPDPEIPDYVFRFHATLERPATIRDNPSEREKEIGIREMLLCVKAEDYDKLLEAYQHEREKQ